jgi:3-hydroxybutyryl-CoA dehydrogenase
MAVTDSSAERLDRSCLIAVIGAGTMGAGIAQIAAVAGHLVKIFDAEPGLADKAIGNIAKNLGKLVDKGRMSTVEAQAATTRLSSATSLADCSKAALVIEAIVESLETKRRVLAEIEEFVTQDCIIASNTSSISITAIGAGLRNPRRLLGMHFFNPAPLMELVEVVSGLATDRRFAEIIHATAAGWGKVAVHAKSTPGFIVNRVARPYYAEGLRLLNEQAATPATIDAVMREAGGFRMGPFELMDVIGHDVSLAVTKSVFNAYYNDPRFTPSLIQQELVNAGFLGRKSGQGFYKYGEGAAKPEPRAEREAAPPSSVLMHDKSPITAALRARLTDMGVRVTQVDTKPNDPLIEIDAAAVYLTDGRSATQRAAETDRRDLVLVDLVLDYSTAKRIALARADRCSDAGYQAIVGLFQVAGFVVTPLADVPGLAVMRTVAMLINEAADVVNQGVCSLQEVDLAMLKGVNYPKGPFAWADEIGVPTVQTVLKNLATHYGEDRYRISPLIQRNAWSGRQFHQ